MKRLIKLVLKTLWRLTDPVRRPIADRFGWYLTRRLHASERALTDEVNVLLNHVVRELHRTQRQVDELQALIEGLPGNRPGQLIAVKVEPDR